MEIYENIAEYYDELYPVTANQKKYYEDLSSQFKKPVKYLRIGCGTGTFELQLSKNGSDVTGIEDIQPLLQSANRKRRTQLMSIRFFQMTNLELSRYLGKGFYDIISILDNRIIFNHDKTLMAKLFYDLKQLLSPNGKLVLTLTNFTKYEGNDSFEIPHKESIRAKLYSKFTKYENDKFILTQNLEDGNGKIINVTKDALTFTINKDKIEEYAKKAGFTDCVFYADFGKNPYNEHAENILVELS